MTIETILDSWTNGQKEQARKQVRRYGLKRFIIDVLEDEWVLRGGNINAVIIYMLSH